MSTKVASTNSYCPFSAKITPPLLARYLGKLYKVVKNWPPDSSHQNLKQHTTHSYRSSSYGTEMSYLGPKIWNLVLSNIRDRTTEIFAKRLYIPNLGFID